MARMMNGALQCLPHQKGSPEGALQAFAASTRQQTSLVCPPVRRSRTWQHHGACVFASFNLEASSCCSMPHCLITLIQLFC